MEGFDASDRSPYTYKAYLTCVFETNTTYFKPWNLIIFLYLRLCDNWKNTAFYNLAKTLQAHRCLMVALLALNMLN